MNWSINSLRLSLNFKIEKYDVVPRKLEIKSSQGETLSSDTALDGASVASILAKRKRKLMIREQSFSKFNFSRGPQTVVLLP